MLGATAELKSAFGKTDHTIHYSYVLCVGDELLLTDCHKVVLSLEEGSTIYNEVTVAGVRCGDTPSEQVPKVCLPRKTQTGSVECTPGILKHTDDQGTLSYCYNGHWTGFCSLTHHEAMVACKQLGYTDYTCKYPMLYSFIIPFAYRGLDIG